MIILDTKTIQTTIDNYEEAWDNNWRLVERELDANLNEIRCLLRKIEDKGGHKASAAIELINECAEDIYNCIFAPDVALKILSRRRDRQQLDKINSGSIYGTSI